MKYITRVIWILSLVSLFTDTASEMLYPILPIYLKSIGFSVVLIGILEGVAEATAGISKGYFGKLSDSLGRRLPFVQVGYALSAISKPMMGILIAPFWVFISRTLDRIGKGVRTGARDALLSDESTSETKAKVFGFHRSMDTLGAVLGPAIALTYLYFHPKDYATLFYIAFVPGLFAIGASFLLKESTKTINKKRNTSGSFFSFLGYWKESPESYRKLVIGLLIFTLFNSSDVFLILKAKESGLNDSMVIGVYIFYNLVYAFTAFPAGALADKIGLKKIFIIGLVFFAFTYTGMAFSSNQYVFLLLFFTYGLYAASTEGISKAWISLICDKKDTATAIGMFTGFQSVCVLVASSFAGFIWFKFGSTVTFILTSVMAVVVVSYFLRFIREPKISYTENS